MFKSIKIYIFFQLLLLGQAIDKLEKSVIILEVLTGWICQSECRIEDGLCWGLGIHVLKKTPSGPYV